MSHSEDDGEWSSGIEDDDLPSFSDDDASSASTSSPHQRHKPRKDSDDEEMPYEVEPRKRRKSWDSEEETGIERLPIKLQNGKVQHTGVKVAAPVPFSEDEESEEVEEETIEVPRPNVEDVSTGARFGRLAVVDLISIKSRKARIQAAKEQLASICQDIIADPENGVRCLPLLSLNLTDMPLQLGLLRRLNTFSQPKISTPTHPDPVPNDNIVRKLALLSQLAVFKDIIPGYRIRPLTDKEKAEKVSQMVQRTRDFEQGLVGVYQSYLRTLESELKGGFNLDCYLYLVSHLHEHSEE